MEISDDVPMSDALPPLVVDLDGTLITSDSFLITLRGLVLAQPQRIGGFLTAMRESRAMAKHWLWENVGLDIADLRYSRTLCAFLEDQADAGRQLVLATGAPEALARAVANHLEIFSVVIGSTPHVNMTGVRKAEALVHAFGEQGFDYAGNAHVDLAIWPLARNAIVCNAPRRAREAARSRSNVILELDDRTYRGPSPQWAIALMAESRARRSLRRPRGRDAC